MDSLSRMKRPRSHLFGFPPLMCLSNTEGFAPSVGFATRRGRRSNPGFSVDGQKHTLVCRLELVPVARRRGLASTHYVCGGLRWNAYRYLHYACGTICRAPSNGGDFPGPLASTWEVCSPRKGVSHLQRLPPYGSRARPHTSTCKFMNGHRCSTD